MHPTMDTIILLPTMDCIFNQFRQLRSSTVPSRIAMVVHLGSGQSCGIEREQQLLKQL